MMTVSKVTTYICKKTYIWYFLIIKRLRSISYTMWDNCGMEKSRRYESDLIFLIFQ